MSVVLDIARTYRAPREVLRRRAAPPASEPRALVYLLAACLLLFLAQSPMQAREAFLEPEIPIESRLYWSFVFFLFLVPLVMYPAAAGAHVIAKVFRGRATWYEARMALFWALLASGPLWLLYGLTLGFVGPGPAATGTGLLAGVAFLVFWVAGLFEVEKGDG